MNLPVQIKWIDVFFHIKNASEFRERRFYWQGKKAICFLYQNDWRILIFSLLLTIQANYLWTIWLTVCLTCGESHMNSIQGVDRTFTGLYSFICCFVLFCQNGSLS